MTKRYTTDIYTTHTPHRRTYNNFFSKIPACFNFKVSRKCLPKKHRRRNQLRLLVFTNRIVNKIERLSTIYYLKIEKSAEIMDAYDFCGLRYAKTDPKQWQEKFKLPRFVYFSLRLE